MMGYLTAANMIEHSKGSKYEVKIANHRNAYNWLTPNTIETIRKAKHSGVTTNKVDDLLKLALLIEHGGILLDVDKIIMLESVDKLNEWIESQPVSRSKPELMLLVDSNVEILHDEHVMVGCGVP